MPFEIHFMYRHKNSRIQKVTKAFDNQEFGLHQDSGYSTCYLKNSHPSTNGRKRVEIPLRNFDLPYNEIYTAKEVSNSKLNELKRINYEIEKICRKKSIWILGV